MATLGATIPGFLSVSFKGHGLRRPSEALPHAQAARKVFQKFPEGNESSHARAVFMIALAALSTGDLTQACQSFAELQKEPAGQKFYEHVRAIDAQRCSPR